MKSTLAMLGLLAAPFATADVYTDALQTIQSAPAEIKAVTDAAPEVFEFNSKFNRSSSVAYNGQVFRNLLMEDIKGAMNAWPIGGYPGTVADAKAMMLSFYEYDENNPAAGTAGIIDGFTDFLTGAVDLEGNAMSITEGFWYSDIQSPGSNLKGKIAGVDNPLRRGKLYGWQGVDTPDALMNLWFDIFAENVVNGKPFTVPNGALAPQLVDKGPFLADGIDYSQLVQKFLYGAVAYSQAARDYLSTDLGPDKGLNADNTQPQKPGVNYTAMEHFWDEGFGYFGAARDLLSYTDADARFKRSIDTNGDGAISLATEKNVGSAINAPRMDLTAADQDMDLSREMMEAFIKGRQLITKTPADYKKYAVAYAQVALTGWEKTMGGVTIHYINKTIKEYQQYGTTEYLYADFAKFWGEMKGYGLVFQFNPKALMSDADFDKIHVLMRDKPVLPHANKAQVDAYIADLVQVRNIIRDAYSFSENNAVNW